MSHFQGIDPYKMLGIQQNATLDEVKDAYRQLARLHHPDKGGNPETFKIIKLAFKMILDNIKKGVPIPQQNSATFVEMRDASQNYQQVQKQPEPHEFLGKDYPIDPNREFDRGSFNQKFMQSRKESEDYLLSAADKDYRENRTKEQLLSEQAAIDGELGKIKPMFTGRDFNNNAFQRMFEFVNGTPEANSKAMQIYDEPQALVSGLQPFTEIDETHKIKQTDKLSSLGFSTFEEGFGGQKNPDHVDRDLLSKFAQQPNITDVNTIEEDYHSKMKKRLNDYQSVQMNFHPKPADTKQLPDQLRATNSATDKVSQQNFNDAFNLKMQERNNLISNLKYGSNGSNQTDQRQLPQPKLKTPQTQPNREQQLADRNIPLHHQALPIMEYPRNSNLPFDSSQPAQMVPTPVMHNQPQQNNDYFIKIPSATQNPHQLYQGGSTQSNYYQPMPMQSMPMQPVQMMPNMNQGYNGMHLPAFQKQPQQQQNGDFEQIQKQLQDLQKTVQQQNKIIRTLALKKPPPKKSQ